MMKTKNYRQLSEKYQSILFQRFIDRSNGEKVGYPKVLDSIEISNKTGSNVRQLCSLIYDFAGQILSSTGKDQTIFQQRIPLKYFLLEELIEENRFHRKSSIVHEKDFRFVSMIEEKKTTEKLRFVFKKID